MRILLLACLLVSVQFSFGQSVYFVEFTDKEGVDFDPYSYFHPDAIERRQVEGLDLYDESDFPVRQDYINTISRLTDSLGYASRWLNGVFAYSNADQMLMVEQLPFVRSVARSQELQVQISETKPPLEVWLSFDEEDLAKYQVERLGDASFKGEGLDGKSVRVAIFDIGFKGAYTHPGLSHLYVKNQVVLTKNFLNSNKTVYGGGTHGTMVLGCLGGMMNQQNLGLATGSEFLLARTEKASSGTNGKEQNWIAAAEWADKNGAAIISSSLVYTNQLYFADEMDGQTTIISKGAKIAAEKGILIVNAAGNEGGIWWRIVGAPGDVEEVLTVGATDPFSDAHASYSSLGPTPDWRMKPNVSAPGLVVTTMNNRFKITQGTSFSAPLVAGFAACLRQKYPRLPVHELFELIEKCSHLSPYFDYAHGYGIPQASNALNGPEEIEPTFEMTAKPYKVSLSFNDEFLDITDSTILIKPNKNLYFAVLDEEDRILEYKVILAEKPNFSVYYSELFDSPPAGMRVRVHFEGYTATQEIPEHEQ